MRKQGYSVMMAAAMAASLLGSAGMVHADETSADYEECTLTFDWWGGETRETATVAAIEAFEAKYPGITINYTPGEWSGGDWESTKALEYQSGAMPDIQQTNFDWISKYHETLGNLYLDLNTVSDTLDLTQYSDSDLATCSDTQGALVGLPVAMTGRTFFWNKATFEQAGLEVPASLADLEAAGPVFQEKLGDNYYPLDLGTYDRAILAAFYVQAQTGVPIIDENGNLTATEDQLKDALDFILRLEDEHVIPTLEYADGEGADSIDKSARFINGEYAGIFEWDTAGGKYVTALGEENGANLVVGNELTDMGPAGSGVFSKVSMMFSISAKTEHPHEATLFLNYLLNDPEGVALMGTERGIPESKIAYDTLSEAGAIDSLQSEAHEAVMSADPMYWNPLFDDGSLKGSTSAYTTIYENLSYDRDSAQCAADLYSAYTEIAPYAEVTAEAESETAAE